MEGGAQDQKTVTRYMYGQRQICIEALASMAFVKPKKQKPKLASTLNNIDSQKIN